MSCKASGRFVYLYQCRDYTDVYRLLHVTYIYTSITAGSEVKGWEEVVSDGPGAV